ncbi:Hypothetical protein A7982_09438 [Minicystis rosea]|nr:Hypothetical protein A7982_09438 [Minicystis rosea]
MTNGRRCREIPLLTFIALLLAFMALHGRSVRAAGPIPVFS